MDISFAIKLLLLILGATYVLVTFPVLSKTNTTGRRYAMRPWFAFPIARQPLSLSSFVAKLREIVAEATDDAEIIRRVRPLARRMARQADWLTGDLYACNKEQGFGVHLLHEEPDHSLALFAVAMLPGRGTPVHNHQTWGVVVGVEGEERNVFWRRLDDGSKPGHADTVIDKKMIVRAGKIVTFLPNDIHSVMNESNRVTVTLEIFGMHINHTKPKRSKFDPEKKTVTEFDVSVGA